LKDANENGSAQASEHWNLIFHNEHFVQGKVYVNQSLSLSLSLSLCAATAMVEISHDKIVGGCWGVHLLTIFGS